MAVPYDDFLSILKRYATEDFDLKKIKKTRTVLTNAINKNKIVDPIRDMDWHMENIRNKFGDPYDLSSKVSDLQQLDDFDNYLKQISDYPNQAKELFKNLGANYATELDPISSKQITNATANIMTNMSLYDDELSFYRQQVLGIKNLQKYQDKDIMGEIEAHKLTEESNHIKNEIINGRSKNTKLKNADRTLRPTVTMNGNSLEFDSIYNYSVPKKIESQIPTTDTSGSIPINDVPNTTDTAPNTNIDPVVEPNNTIDTNTVENNIDNATKNSGRTYNRSRRDGKNVRQQMEQRKKTKNKGRSKIPNSNKNTTQLNKEAQQRKWSTETYKKWQQEETINKINSTRQMYEDVLTDWQSSSGNFSRSVDNYKLTNTHKMYSEAGEYLDYVEDLKVNYNMDDYVDGSYTMEKEVFKYSKGTGLNGEDVLKIEGGLVDAPNAYASDLNKTLKEAAEEMSPEEFAKFKNGFDVDSALVQTDTGGVKLNRQRVVRNAPDMLSKFGTIDMVMSGVNLLGAVGDYKDARRKGHGVVSSAVRAGAQFAIGEALGLWAIPVMAAKELPGLVVKGADALYKENRKMNSMANFQAFGGAQFQDTQQLATMRQSGMEMAKMANYNLQQTLMGNEATYLHR